MPALLVGGGMAAVGDGLGGIDSLQPGCDSHRAWRSRAGLGKFTTVCGKVGSADLPLGTEEAGPDGTFRSGKCGSSSLD